MILSGANISSTYLSTRQDRYIVIRSAPQLAALLRAVVDTVGRFSYQLRPLPLTTQAAEAGANPAAAAGGSFDKEAGSAGSRPRRRDVLLQLLQEQRLPWQQVGQLGDGPGRSWGQSLAALLGQQLEQSSQQGGSEQQGGSQQQQLGLAQERQQATSGAGVVNAQQQRGQQAQQAQREHHLKRHRLQRQQRYHLEGCPAGVDPVRQAGLFSWRLHRELLPLFVAALDEGQEWEQQQQGQQPAAGPDTWLVPVVQAGFGGLRQEEKLTLATLAWAAGLPEAQLPWNGLPAAPWLDTNAISGNHASSDGSRGSQGWGAAMPSWRGSVAAWRRSSGGGGSSALVQLASPYLNLARPLERFLSRRVRWCQDKHCCCAFCEACLRILGISSACGRLWLQPPTCSGRLLAWSAYSTAARCLAGRSL